MIFRTESFKKLALIKMVSVFKVPLKNYKYANSRKVKGLFVFSSKICTFAYQ